MCTSWDISYFTSTFDAGRHLWFSFTPTNDSIYISPVGLLDIEKIGIAVGISLLSCMQAEIYVIHLVPGRYLWFFTHPDVLTFVPLCCCKRYADYVEISHFSICNVRFKCFRFHVRHFDFRLNYIQLCTGRFWYQQRGLQYPQKQTRRWFYFQRWFMPFDSMVTKFIKFLLKISTISSGDVVT